MKLHYTNQAIADIDTAMGWYEKQRKGLGFDFLDCVEVAVNQVLENPKFYSLKHKTLRGILIRRFPFTLYYNLEGSLIVIHAVFDNRQDPENKP